MTTATRALSSPWITAALIAILSSHVATLYVIMLITKGPTPITIEEPIIVENAGHRVVAGEPLYLIVRYCKTVDSFGWVGGTFASRGTVFPIVGAWPQTLPVGCPRQVRLAIPTQATMPAGSFKFYMARDYRPTVLFSQPVRAESEAFDVVSRDDK